MQAIKLQPCIIFIDEIGEWRLLVFAFVVVLVFCENGLFNKSYAVVVKPQI